MTEFELLMNLVCSNIEKYHSINPLEFEVFKSKYAVNDSSLFPNSFHLIYKATMSQIFKIQGLNSNCIIWIKNKHFGWHHFIKLNDNVWINYNDKIRDIGIDDRSLEVLTVLGMETKLCTIDNRKATVIEINNLQINE